VARGQFTVPESIDAANSSQQPVAEHGDGQLGSLVPSRCRSSEVLHAAAELRESQQAAFSIEGLVQLLQREASAQLMQQ
jgi:hypothetical protein